MRNVNLLVAAGLAVLGAGCADVNGGYGYSGYPSYGYTGYNSGYSSNSGYYPSRSYNTGYVYPTAPSRSYDSNSGYSSLPRRYGPNGDYDRDGIPNKYDRDANGDGVPDRWQR
jgi:hypothetical protein